MSLLDGVEHVPGASGEHRAGDDAEGGAHHVLVDGMDRAGRAVPHRSTVASCRSAHSIAEMSELVMTKQRRGDAALPTPLMTLLRDHRIAEDRSQYIDLQLAFRKLGRSFKQQVFTTSLPVMNAMRGGPGAMTRGSR